ncbi:hypothetical protein [Anthocerotibacter panamensis]|uniref:hypothetical protein n=1 Tax=Anthocerotibacter panamensis TaxID=2857077 RepID=UPI001C4053DA|nr:hypothetical protein [Anthocerotibacter panamensis]
MSTYESRQPKPASDHICQPSKTSRFRLLEVQRQMPALMEMPVYRPRLIGLR